VAEQLNTDSEENKGSVELIFYLKEFTVPEDEAITPAVEEYLVDENINEGGSVLAFAYHGNLTYHFYFCKRNMDHMNNTEQQILVTPWQVISWADPSVPIFIPSGHEFCTIRLAAHYEMMAAGDPIEFFRISDGKALGNAEVIWTKRTLIKYLTPDDVRDFRRVIGGKESKEDILTLLSGYYEAELLPDTGVVVMRLRALTSIISDPAQVSDIISTQSVGAVIRGLKSNPPVRSI
jgi:hypothetical protein